MASVQRRFRFGDVMQPSAPQILTTLKPLELSASMIGPEIVVAILVQTALIKREARRSSSPLAALGSLGTSAKLSFSFTARIQKRAIVGPCCAISLDLSKNLPQCRSATKIADSRTRLASSGRNLASISLSLRC